MKLISEFEQVALDYGGRCLSRDFSNKNNRIEWQCKNGHRFVNSLYNIKLGYWCPKCRKLEEKQAYLDQIIKIAQEKGGKCLSAIYVNNYSHLEFQCKNGHLFSANANNIKSGWWCKHCSGSFKHDLQMYQEYAESMGGKLISKKYVNVDELMEWECSEKHRWKATAYSVKKQNYWCPVCEQNIRRIRHSQGYDFVYSLEDMQALAIKNEGVCLSKAYKGSNVSLKWKCKNDHIWNAMPSKIVMGQWCRICAYQQNGLSKRTNLEYYIKIIEKRGGKVLSSISSFRDTYPDIKLICDKGHEWVTTVHNIRGGSWCPHPDCKGDAISQLTRLPFSVYKKLAKANGGKLISKESEYKNTRSKLVWQCKNMHQWIATAGSVKSGSWCQKCYWLRVSK